ncbi:MAG: 4Fe-4S binding protein [Spirochaetes bacterium]|nr:4Fe-4S binding protein [Spirochaetota bacterium]
MEDDIYCRLRDILDSMPHGFPSTGDGLEIRILKKIFTPEEAAVATMMKMKFETPEEIALRTGRNAEYLRSILKVMGNKGQIFGVTLNGMPQYKLPPFVFGIYEWQINRLDRELAEMVEEYFHRDFGREFYGNTPPLLRVVPVEASIPAGSVVMLHESIQKLVRGSSSWAVGECICKKEKRLLGGGCDNPIEVCLAIAPVEGLFDDFFWGRPIGMDEALEILRHSEEAGLVHMTSNTREGHIFICNCCGCCCGILRGINELGHMGCVARSDYEAVVDPALCTACGTCLERCQVRAVEIDSTARVNTRCIGCGLCAGTCPSSAIRMVRRDEEMIERVPRNEKEWMRRRASSRGRFEYRDLLK